MYITFGFTYANVGFNIDGNQGGDVISIKRCINVRSRSCIVNAVQTLS